MIRGICAQDLLMNHLFELAESGKRIIFAVGPVEGPPFPVDGIVYEEDTYLTLSADPEFRPPDDHPVRVLTEAYAAEPERPGTVLVKTGPPLRLLAIVHKLDEEPTWREEWVSAALDAVLKEVERRGLRSLGLPLLGTVHGRLKLERSLALLAQALRKASSTSLEHVWLRPGKHSPRKIRSLLLKGI